MALPEWQKLFNFNAIPMSATIMSDLVINNPYWNLTKDAVFFTGFTAVLVGTGCLILALLLYLRYRSVRTRMVLYIAFSMFFMCLSFIFGGISYLLAWLVYDMESPGPIVAGIPLVFIEAYWPLQNIGYQFLMLSNVFMLLFTAKLYLKPAKYLTYAYVLIACSWIVLTTYYGIFIFGLELHFDPEASSVSVPGRILLVVLGIIAYFLLFYHSYTTSKHQKDTIIRRGTQLIGVGGISGVITFIWFVATGLLRIHLEFTSAILIFIPLLFVYLGLVMPQWLRETIVRTSAEIDAIKTNSKE